MKFKTREIIKIIKLVLASICLISVSILIYNYTTNDYTDIIESLEKENSLLLKTNKQLSEQSIEATYNISYSEEVQTLKDRKNEKSYWYITFTTQNITNGFTVRACKGYDFELSDILQKIRKENKVGENYLEIRNFQRISFEQYLKYKKQ